LGLESFPNPFFALITGSCSVRHIYLDYNATTPIAPAVKEAMQPFLGEFFANPSSGHALGRACHEAIEDARGQVAALLACDAEEIVFTGGGSESNNLALKGVMMRGGLASAGHLIISSIEHPAISEPAAFLETLGFDVTVVPCDRHGVVSPQKVEEAIRMDTALVSIMHANNEIGSIQPIREIAEICHDHDILVHTDAAQSVGKIHTRVDELGVDMLTLVGHKFYAPKGVGALFVRRGVSLEPVIHGAGHEAGLRAGTENTPHIVAIGKAAQLAHANLDEAADRMAELRDRLFARLKDALQERITVNAAEAERLPNTLSVNFLDASGGEILGRCPELCASTGAACHAGDTNMSSTLASIGISLEEARGAVRLSVGWYTNEDEIDRSANSLIAACEALRI